MFTPPLRVWVVELFAFVAPKKYFLLEGTLWILLLPAIEEETA